MIRLIATLMLLQPFAASAQTTKENYATLQNGFYHLAVPNKLQVLLARHESSRLPSCASLTKDLELKLDAIETCGLPENRKDEFCKFTVRTIRQNILGIKSEITRTREADAKQSWTLTTAVPKIQTNDLTLLASELALAAEQLPKAQNLTAVVRHVEVDTSKSKLLRSLAKLDDAELSEIAINDQTDAAATLTTTSRAVTCELLAGNISLHIDSDVNGTFEIPADQDRMAKLWKMKTALEPVATWNAKQDRYKFILAGHRLSSLENQDQPEDLEKNVLANSELLIDFAAAEFKLVDYKNRFSLGQRLPQTKVEHHYTAKQTWDIR